MAFKALGPAALQVVQALRPVLAEAKDRALPVRVGVSGGADSMALAAGVAHLLAREFQGLDVLALNIDHQLQPGSSQLSAKVVEAMAGLGLATSTTTVNVTAKGIGMEAAARKARLDALTDDFSGLVLLGHSMDDQAETVLLRLAHGSGTRSLAAIPERSTWRQATLVRPLLGLRRGLLRQAAEQWQLPIWEDPQNAQARFARVRVRETCLPTLEAELGPGVVQSLARSAKLTRMDADALDTLAEQALGEPAPTLPIERLRQQPEAIATRMVRLWASSVSGAEITFRHVTAIWQLVTKWRGQSGVDLPGGIRVQRVNNELISIG